MGGIEMFASNEYLQKVSSKQALTFDCVLQNYPHIVKKRRFLTSNLFYSVITAIVNYF